MSSKRILLFQEKAFPISCGRRKCIFTGTSSLPIKTILVNIDNGLPTAEGVQQSQDEALLFLDEVKLQLENANASSFSTIFAGSIEERFGIPFSQRKVLPSPLGALCSDYDVMFCYESYNATFSRRRGNILIEPLSLPLDESLILPGFCRLDAKLRDQFLNPTQFLRSVHEAVRLSKVLHLPGDPYVGI